MSLESLTILIVDDQDFIRLLLRKMLTQIGVAQVIEAGDGVSGLHQVAEHAPDLVICDVRMRPLDGFGFVEALRRQPGGETLPVILLTGQADPDTEARARALGITAFLAKPVQGPALRAQIAAAIRVEPPAARS